MDEEKGERLIFEDDGAYIHGYLALPADRPAPGVIVVQEWWGLTRHVTDVADRLAGDGFAALAPDLYGGTSSHDESEALRLMQELPRANAVSDLAGSIGLLLARPEVRGDTVGVVGFCMGGGFALELAARHPSEISAVVGFYPVLGEQPLDVDDCPVAVMLHVAEHDDMFTPEHAEIAADLLRTAGADVTTHVYHDADHAFFNDRGSTYQLAAARLSWRRTITLLGMHLGDLDDAEMVGP